MIQSFLYDVSIWSWSGTFLFSKKAHALAPTWVPDWMLHQYITLTEILFILSTVTIIC